MRRGDVVRSLNQILSDLGLGYGIFLPLDEDLKLTDGSGHATDALACRIQARR